eukprot:m.1475898 g.1475898  ORF g.1475898 m.1475898 type:complete len:61 (-) comp25156_c0_seq8:4731-4913(-)
MFWSLDIVVTAIYRLELRLSSTSTMARVHTRVLYLPIFALMSWKLSADNSFTVANDLTNS